MYIVEGKVQPDEFGTIPEAAWWAIVTLGTIGYGDVIPMTPAGRLVASDPQSSAGLGHDRAAGEHSRHRLCGGLSTTAVAS